ncbi:MAG: chromosomal replication initiator protein DnaA [Clostridiales bacterium]|nr:chromosomal replication initiator protein DnaA [Clostridiales bacterium]
MESFAEVWEQVLEYCKSVMSETSYKMWIETIEKAEFTDGQVVISSTNDFRNTILKDKFKDTFNEAFEKVIGINIDLVFESLDKEVYTKENTENQNITEFHNPHSTDAYNFDNFIVGSSNKFAHAASWRVATADIGSVFNPLFIYGNSGLGKTHLMLAIQNEMKKRNDNINIIYTTSENFMNEFISCITKKDNITFREKYRNADALFIDDIQFMKNKISTQEEFFHTFNDLINANKQIVITSDRPPKEIEGLDDRIKTRFESGLIADIQPPDLETRIAIIIQKANDHNLTLSKQIINYIAEKIKDNIRQIEGTINKIAAMQTLYGITPTMSSIQQIIHDIETDNRPVSATVDAIIESVADKYDLRKEDLVSDKRNANISLARNVSMYVIREVTGLSLENIGNKFGGKKHSTVKHSIDNVEERMIRDVKFKNTVYNIIKEFKDS